MSFNLKEGNTMVEVYIETVDGKKIIEPYGNEDRCDNCGKPISEVKSVITGGFITEGEWACCEECQEEMENRGCCFEELGQYIYRKQKY
jgi:bifunctional DNA-binding transcriptional regulator/antitoxin component of YhaV-PrlF toxin-antitoxin module